MIFMLFYTNIILLCILMIFWSDLKFWKSMNKQRTEICNGWSALVDELETRNRTLRGEIDTLERIVELYQEVVVEKILPSTTSIESDARAMRIEE